MQIQWKDSWFFFFFPEFGFEPWFFTLFFFFVFCLWKLTDIHLQSKWMISWETVYMCMLSYLQQLDKILADPTLSLKDIQNDMALFR